MGQRLLSSAFLLASFFFALVAGQCGNAGEDYYDLRNLQVTNPNRIMSSPNWIFPYFDPICTPTDSPSCPSGTCDPLFQKRATVTYVYNCVITNISVVNAVIANLSDFNPGFTDPCACSLPATPSGKYLNGYNLTIWGKFSQSGLDGTVEYYKGCEVAPSYSSSPLSNGDIFSQTFVLNGTNELANNLFSVIVMALIATLLVW